MNVFVTIDRAAPFNSRAQFQIYHCAFSSTYMFVCVCVCATIFFSPFWNGKVISSTTKKTIELRVWIANNCIHKVNRLKRVFSSNKLRNYQFYFFRIERKKLNEIVIRTCYKNQTCIAFDFRLQAEKWRPTSVTVVLVTLLKTHRFATFNAWYDFQNQVWGY